MTWFYFPAIQTFKKAVLLRSLKANDQSQIWKMDQVPKTQGKCKRYRDVAFSRKFSLSWVCEGCSIVSCFLIALRINRSDKCRVYEERGIRV